MFRTGISRRWVYAIVLGGIVGLSGCQSVATRSMKIYIQQSQWVDAAKQSDEAVASEPKSAEVWFDRGVIHSELNRYEIMVEAFDRSAELSKKYRDRINAFREKEWVQIYNNGVAELGAGATDTAMTTFRLAVFVYPDRSEAYRVLGSGHLNAGNADSAIYYFKESLARNPSDVQLAGVLAQIYADSSEFDQAIALLENGRGLEPENMSVARSLVDIYGQAGMISKMVTTANGLSDDKVIQFTAGVALLRAGTDSSVLMEQAIPFLKRALMLDSSYTDAAFNLAFAYQNLNRAADAIEPLTAVVNVRPDDMQAWFSLGRARVMVAQEYSRKSHELAGAEKWDESEAESGLANGLYRSAEKALLKVTAIAPSDIETRQRYADTHRLLATIYAQTERSSEAEAAFSTFEEYK